MAVRLKDLHLCEEAIVSSNGQVSIINMFDVIRGLNLPAIHPKFAIFLSFTGDEGRYPIRIEIVNPQNNTPIASLKGTINIIKDSVVGNFIANFINLMFPVEGKHWIKVDVDGNILSKPDEHFILIKKQIS